MPFYCHPETLTVLLIVLLIYAMSPVEMSSKEPTQRRHLNDVLLLFLLVVGVAVLVEGHPNR